MGRTIIITGATGKFGKILVRNFLIQGDVVIAIGRSKKKLNELKTLKSKKYNKLFVINVDLMKEGAILRIIKLIKKLKLKPDSLINNARNLDYLRLDKKNKTSSKNFLNEFKLGVVIPYQLVMAMTESFLGKFKNVVNIGSIYGTVAPNKKLYKNLDTESSIQYGVTKSALEHLTKELAVRLAKNSVRVNCAAFGGVEGRVNKTFKKRYADLCPSGRMISENEIFGPIDMLISEKTSGVTGHILMIDGGWTIW